MSELRRPSAARFSGALWGLLIAGSGTLMIASFSGVDVDADLALIIGLSGIGLWLLLSALFASGVKSRGVGLAAEPATSADQPLEK